MKKLNWTRKVAKRMVAEDALRRALEQIEGEKPVGGARTATGAFGYRVARHLAQHAADQLRLSEGE